MKNMKRVLMALVCACMLAAMAFPFPAKAADIGNAQVKEASKGVIQVLVTYVDAENTEWIIQSGSGFFIGSEAGPDTIVTNHHVVAMDEETRENAKQAFGRDIINDVEIKIVVDRDLTKKATITELNSADYDIAVLKLEEPLAQMGILTLSTEEPQKTQNVYALGFPDLAQIVKDKQFYTADDVTITNGTISDITEIGQTLHIQHECNLTSGNSGGPLLNEAGEVVGVNRADVDDKYYYSVKISELTKLLDKMNIAYNTSSGTVGGSGNNDDDDKKEEVTVDKSALQKAIDDAKAKDAKLYDEDSYSFLKAAIEDGEKVVGNADATQEMVDQAAADIKSAQENLVEKKGLPMPVIIGIVAAAVVIIIIIVAVIIAGKKKKKAAPSSEIPAAGPASHVSPAPSHNPSPAPGPGGMPGHGMTPMPGAFDMAGSDETSVLNEGAGQTTVLSAQAVPTATLKRMSSGETAIINKARYVLGKEKRKVDFCVSNNSSISRIHAVVIYDNGAFYIEDQNATNFTFVNGNKVNPGQRVKINNGDKIKLSDEEFEFKA